MESMSRFAQLTEMVDRIGGLTELDRCYIAARTLAICHDVVTPPMVAFCVRPAPPTCAIADALDLVAVMGHLEPAPDWPVPGSYRRTNQPNADEARQVGDDARLLAALVDSPRMGIARVVSAWHLRHFEDEAYGHRADGYLRAVALFAVDIGLLEGTGQPPAVLSPVP